MPTISAEDLRQLGVRLFTGVGVPQGDAELVADHMVESGLLGHDSHSVLRYPQYVNMVRDGAVKPGAKLEILQELPRMAQVSGNWNFGPVTATAAVELALDKARDAALSVVTVKHCNHVARLGRFAALAARENLIGMICANGHGSDLAVAPFGGRERRLPTNPISVAIPTGAHEWPVVLDMTTSMTSGGALREYRNRNEAVPEGSITDAEGEPTTDVEDYYAGGAILPLGFPATGHKGTGLALVIDVLAGALSGAGCSQADSTETGNALFIAVLNPEAFLPLEEFTAEVDRFIDWVKSSPPAAGFDEVLLPGENSHRIYQERSRRGMDVDTTAWEQIAELAEELGVELPPQID